MLTPFGPQLIGETEKTLNAVLRRILDGTGLTEPQWVALRLAEQLGDGDGGDCDLAVLLHDRAHFVDAPDLVSELTARGLLVDSRLTLAGRRLVNNLQARIATDTEAIWRDLPADDVSAATRVLNAVAARARAVIAST